MIPTVYEWSSDAPVAMTNDCWITVREDLVMISAGGRYRVLWRLETMPAKLAALAAMRVTT